MTFAWIEAEFKAFNCELVGLSVDGLNNNIAWLRTIKEKIEYKGMKDVEVKFPLIEDITMEVAKKYGMIQPGESERRRYEMLRLVLLHQRIIRRKSNESHKNRLKQAFT